MAITRDECARQRANVIPIHLPRVVSDPKSNEHFVVFRSYGWSYGSRTATVVAARDLMTEIAP